MLDHIYHPQRLNYPMKRVGERGQGQWQRVTWDQALDEVAEKLAGLKEKYGAETLTFTHGAKRTYHWDCRRFFNLFGSPNTCGVNNICMCPSYATEYATYGGMVMGSEVMGLSAWSCGAVMPRNDHDFVANWTVGFEELKAAVEVYTPEKVAEITMVPVDLIMQAARMYATAGSAVIPFGVGMDKQGVNSTQCAPGRGPYSAPLPATWRSQAAIYSALPAV